jgi:hypothetical protein
MGLPVSHDPLDHSDSLIFLPRLLCCANTLAATYLPPKSEQALLQGGTFVFCGPRTLFAHYDPSTAAHASINDVLAIAEAAATTKLQTK